PGIVALDDVSMEVKKGAIYGIVGKNGAGKSVLMNVIAGLLPATSGEISILGERVDMRRYNRPKAHEMGVALVPQEPTWAPEMTVRSNLFLGSDLTHRFGIIDVPRFLRTVDEVMERVGIRARPDGRMKHLPIEDQQMLAFGKALYIEHARVILLDEITATLPRERKISFLEFLRAEVERSPELSFTLISHHIDEIMEFCDRVTVMRDGKAIGPLEVKETSKAELADLITGGVSITMGGGTR
ncbi:MAG TPA: ATP-binding cassette domain-containing protein, partial [Rubrobacteraceae bacterium]|nr:ATP-binding cassette domain-containing protein [Rubrobacteraceae bacterium]